jgi:hypothetical protein
MRLNELIERVAQSEPKDWHAIHGHPTYRDNLEGVRSGAQHWIEIHSHHSVATFVPDASITMAWGLQVIDDFKEPWANTFSDPHASSANVDVFYNGALVYRALYILVDGARCYLPLPDQRQQPGGVPELYARFIKLLDRIAGQDQFDEYFQRAGLARMPERPWPQL